MLFSAVDTCIISEEEIIELINRARQYNFQHFLFLCLYLFRVEQVYFHACFVQASIA
jgi:hypothetical protein